MLSQPGATDTSRSSCLAETRPELVAPPTRGTRRRNAAIPKAARRLLRDGRTRRRRRSEAQDRSRP